VNSQHIQVGPTWFLIGVAGVGANFVGGWLWLGLGPALFVTGALTVALSWGSIAVFFWLAAHWSPTGRQEGRGD
jgi:hypothetical protein